MRNTSTNHMGRWVGGQYGDGGPRWSGRLVGWEGVSQPEKGVRPVKGHGRLGRKGKAKEENGAREKKNNIVAVSTGG